MKRMKCNNLAIIQARMGSSRLPNKVMKELYGKPMLQHVIERVGTSKKIERIIVATTDRVEDRVIGELCERIGIDCYYGSENDVLDRYYCAAMYYEPQNVIRVTADCPLIDPYLIDYIIGVHEEGRYDYTSNTLVETYPDGLDTEVFTYNALKTAWENADLVSEREHVTPYIKFKDDFRRFSVERTPSLGEKRWTVDTDRDFEVVKRIYAALYDEGKIFSMDETLEFLSKHPEIESINKDIIRNEGYLKSIRADKRIDLKYKD